MDLTELSSLLAAMGCPPEKSAEMAAQLDRRAQQLAEQKGRSYDEALTHLLSLMRQGLAVQGKCRMTNDDFALRAALAFPSQLLTRNCHD